MTDLALTTVVNLRDVGGHATRQGGRVRRGLLYRSGNLSELDGADRLALEHLGLRMIYDLRSDAERSRMPDRLPTGAEYVPLDLLAGVMEGSPGQLFAVIDEPERAEAVLGGGRAERIFTEQYRHFVSLPSARAGLGRLFRDLGEPSRRPALIHCATGKDRTGWAAAALLLLLGVPTETVEEDYLASGPRLAGLHQPFFDAFRARGGDPALFEPIMAVRADYLETALDELHRRYGTIEAYFARGLGIAGPAQDALRDAFLTDAPNGASRVAEPGLRA
ncbi:MAG: tyrosine-protein phosphatase [Candidatus Limnocylindrales bacterium]